MVWWVGDGVMGECRPMMRGYDGGAAGYLYSGVVASMVSWCEGDGDGP